MHGNLPNETTKQQSRASNEKLGLEKAFHFEILHDVQPAHNRWPLEKWRWRLQCDDMSQRLTPREGHFSWKINKGYRGFPRDGNWEASRTGISSGSIPQFGSSPKRNRESSSHDPEIPLLELVTGAHTDVSGHRMSTAAKPDARWWVSG